MAPPTFMGLSGQHLSLAVTTVATTGFLLFGYDQGVMSGIITAAPFNDVFVATRNNSTMQGLVTAIYEIGCLLGAMFILAVGDLLGRRKAIILGALVMLVGVIIQVTAMPGTSPLAQFIVGRVVMGVGNGINTSTIPTYQAECSKTSNRGLLICIEGSTIAFGTLMAYWIDYGASYGPPDLTWRFPIAFQIIFSLTISIPMVFLPESPRWLLSHGRVGDADKVIAALRGYETTSEATILERNLIVDSLRASGGFGQKSTPIKLLFTHGKTQHFRRMMLGASSQLMQQIGGCNAVIYFLPVLLESIDLTRNMSLLIGGVNMIVYSLSATSSWFLIERVGRRRLFLYGTAGQMLSMTIAFACLIPGHDTPEIAKGAVVGFFLYIASFGATWLPLPWLYPAEVNPVKTRAKANAVSTCTNWLFNFVVVMVVPVMVARIGWGTYLFFAACNACFLPVIWFLYPETARRSLEEIDIIFAKGYVERISYVKAAEELPHLRPEEIMGYATRYGLVDPDARDPNRRDGDDHDEKSTGTGTGTDGNTTTGSGDEAIVNELSVEAGFGDMIKSEKEDSTTDRLDWNR